MDLEKGGSVIAQLPCLGLRWAKMRKETVKIEEAGDDTWVGC